MSNFPNTAVLDNFNRTENPVSDGGAWNTTSPAFAEATFLKTNGTVALTTAVAGTSSGSIWNTPFTVPVEAYLTIAAPPVSNSFDFYWISAPTTGSPTGFSLTFTSSSWNLYAVPAFTSLATASLTSAAGDQCGFSYSITGIITVWYKTAAGAWTVLKSVTNTTYLAQAGYLSLDSSDTAATFDNFGGGVPSSSSSPTRRMPLGS